MSTSSSLTSPLRAQNPLPQPRSAGKRARIIEVAMRHFAEHGYESARVADIAAELGIAKGSVFQHFGSKDGLFLQAYKKAVRAFSPYMNVPAEVLKQGFFEVLRYWLVRTEHMVREDWVPYRVYLLGNYGTDLALKREINRFLLAEDPYGRIEFVRWGLQRGELRSDVDLQMIVSIIDWMVERFQDALLIEELDPGLFHRPGDPAVRKDARIRQFLELLRRAIGNPHQLQSN
jgi:TetR/AcrR family transcriptional regulator